MQKNNPRTNALSPCVTVLMPVYNGEQFLHEATNSILTQTFADFEFLIINDGSTDSTVEIINSFQDERIRLINNKKNLGIVTSLNKGLTLARGKYIARMDADDIALPYRLEKQVDFMDNHPEIGVSGSWVKTIGKYPNQIHKFPTDPELLKCILLFRSPIAHPSVIIRKDTLLKNDLKYNINRNCAQDYDLWIRCTQITKLSNIAQVLLLYRNHDHQVSSEKFQIQRAHTRSLILFQLEQFLNITPTRHETDLHLSIIEDNFDTNMSFYNVNLWFTKLLKKNRSCGYLSQTHLAQTLQSKAMDIINAKTKKGIPDWSLLVPTQKYHLIHLSISQRIRFFIVSLKNRLQTRHMFSSFFNH